MGSKKKGDNYGQSELDLPAETPPRNLPKKPQNKKKFFNKQEQHSAVKSAIVEAYFLPWARISGKSTGRVLYMDLFAGPGRYDNGEPSTPLLILQKIIDNPELHSKVVTFFGDQDNHNIEKLQRAVSAVPGINKLKHPPIIRAGQVTAQLNQELAALKLVPTLMFLDPFGYKGVGVDLIRAVIQNSGSECLFFFNYNRVMPAIANPGVRHLVDAIFGQLRVNHLQQVLPSLNNAGTEEAVIRALRESMNEVGGGYVLPFRFRKNGRTTHHLVFVSAHPLGHKIMKEIMGARSSDHYQDVPSFEFREGPVAPGMFEEEARPIEDLKTALLETFAGKELKVQDVFDQHNLGTPYVLKNYKEALKQLMREGQITEVLQPGKVALQQPYKFMPDDRIIRFS